MIIVNVRVCVCSRCLNFNESRTFYLCLHFTFSFFHPIVGKRGALIIHSFILCTCVAKAFLLLLLLLLRLHHLVSRWSSHCAHYNTHAHILQALTIHTCTFIRNGRWRIQSQLSFQQFIKCCSPSFFHIMC